MAEDTDTGAPPAPAKRRVRREAITPGAAGAPAAAVETDSDTDALPASVTLASRYGYYDDEGNGHFWSEGQVVTDPAEIAVLVDRGALFLPD